MTPRVLIEDRLEHLQACAESLEALLHDVSLSTHRFVLVGIENNGCPQGRLITRYSITLPHLSQFSLL